ncbi:MAG TPA: hypothetical protein DCR93_12765 [Cytophagales bacterium]|nr:hypothetical protein [Cytophagales bacterium]HAP60318.1 hypothetical protein [Cytophagales bacterium]
MLLAKDKLEARPPKPPSPKKPPSPRPPAPPPSPEPPPHPKPNPSVPPAGKGTTDFLQDPFVYLEQQYAQQVVQDPETTQGLAGFLLDGD